MKKTAQESRKLFEEAVRNSQPRLALEFLVDYLTQAMNDSRIDDIVAAIERLEARLDALEQTKSTTTSKKAATAAVTE